MDKKVCKVCGFVFHDETIIVCPLCGRQREATDEEIIRCISTDESFIEAMLALKEKDPIEYQLKISQFKTQLKQQEKTQQVKPTEPNNQPKCPRCKSTAITAGQRGYSLIWGFFGSGNTVNRCSNCGHKWKP